MKSNVAAESQHFASRRAAERDSIVSVSSGHCSSHTKRAEHAAKARTTKAHALATNLVVARRHQLREYTDSAYPHYTEPDRWSLPLHVGRPLHVGGGTPFDEMVPTPGYYSTPECQRSVALRHRQCREILAWGPYDHLNYQ